MGKLVYSASQDEEIRFGNVEDDLFAPIYETDNDLEILRTTNQEWTEWYEHYYVV
jgi:hypothetical protein